MHGKCQIQCIKAMAEPGYLLLDEIYREVIAAQLQPKHAQPLRLSQACAEILTAGADIDRGENFLQE